MQKKEYIIHALFWFLPLIYILFLSDNYIIGVFSKRSETLTIPLLYGTLYNILLFYIVSFILIPRTFRKGNYLHWTIKLLAVLLVITFIESLTDLMYIKLIDFHKTYRFMGDLFVGNFVIHIVILGLSLAYAFSKKTIQNEKNKQKLIQEKLKTELDYLKSQINPHFLFNILNNLFSLAHSNNDHETADGIFKLSKMMRYMLYEGNNDKIPLNKEIEYIENYIDLQKLRFHPDDEIEIPFEKHGDFNAFMISPLLLIPFVENAFKHGISFEKKSRIFIDAKLENNLFTFKVWNTKCRFYPQKNSQKEYSGFGLDNAKNRLDILYQDRYELDINDHEHNFEVILKIKY